MENAYTSFSTKETPQSEPIPGSDQEKMESGGYAWRVDKWSRLERFLILGSEGGTFYVDERELTLDNANNVIECIKEDGRRAVDMIVEISDEGRAPSNDPALFALALASSLGDVETRSYALDHLNDVARIFTHLSHFLTYVQQFRGWGRLLREAVSQWYLEKDEGYLAYQMVKYRKRDGWTHQDVLRLAHPRPDTDLRNALFGYAVESLEDPSVFSGTEASIVQGFERAKYAESEREIVQLIDKYGLTREMLPTEYLTSPVVWEALLGDGDMPTWALLRNLGNMGSSGLLVEGNWGIIDTVTSALTNRERLARSRMHPLKVLVGLKTYSQGSGFYGSNDWPVVQEVVDALDDAFYKSFDIVEPTGKNLVIGLDVSGSMWTSIGGMANVNAMEAGAAMSMVNYRVEPRTIVKAFSDRLVDFRMSRNDTLEAIVDRANQLPFGGTDASLPIQWALKNSVEVDAFITYTDNQTWAGDIHVVQILKEYRQKMGIPAKSVVVNMTSAPWSMNDPQDDVGSLDVVGMDTSVPDVISGFISE